MNPYFINEPSGISLSGGLTSAFMLYRHLQAHDGVLPSYVTVMFCNTGKEMQQTLQFVKDIGDHWDVNIVWLELKKLAVIENIGKRNKIVRTYAVTDFVNASRNGEPFDAVLKGLDAIPNPVARTCSVNMKIRAMKWYMESVGYESPWTQYIGIRADEQSRAVRLHGLISEGHEAYLPLWLDGITKKDVGDFWKENNFTLGLPSNNGVTDLGNCDLCFLKSRGKRQSIINIHPKLADWWINAENLKNQRFRQSEQGYETMKLIVSTQKPMDFSDDTGDMLDCFCTD